MKRYLHSTVFITVLTFLSQVLSFLIQAVIARRFGAQSAMDGFWLGVTLPQYAVSVCVHAIGFVFLPVFVSYFEKNDEASAWRIACGLLTWVSVILGALVAAGVVWAEPLLRWTAPGLMPGELAAAVGVARLTWPTVLIMAWGNILANLYQARQAFMWQASSPFLGSLVNLALLVPLTRLYGIYGVAAANTIGLSVQMLLLMPVLLKERRFQFSGSWRHPGVHEVLRHLWPLVLSGLLIRWTPVVDRYLASQLPAGVVSHLGYAFRISGMLSVLISIGLTTVVFPRLAISSAHQDIPGLLQTVSLAFRTMWLLVAPVVVFGMILAIPGLAVLFERGAFRAADSAAVGGLLQIYLLSLGASCLGNITSRVYYSLKKTRILAILGPVEALVYAAYAYGLASALGARGIAISYVVYFNASLIWQLWILRRLLGPLGGWDIARSIGRITLAAGIAAVPVWLLCLGVKNPWVQVVVGGVGGLALYMTMLQRLGSREWQVVRDSLRGAILARQTA